MKHIRSGPKPSNPDSLLSHSTNFQLDCIQRIGYPDQDSLKSELTFSLISGLFLVVVVVESVAGRLESDLPICMARTSRALLFEYCHQMSGDPLLLAPSQSHLFKQEQQHTSLSQVASQMSEKVAKSSF